MAKNRYIGDYPVIGIRPVVDGRRGPQMMRESLEPQVWAMANAAKKLFEENLFYSNGEPVKVVMADTCIGRVPETAACADKFKKEGFLSNLCHARGDSYAGQFTALFEGSEANLCCPLGNDGNTILNFKISHNVYNFRFLNLYNIKYFKSFLQHLFPTLLDVVGNLGGENGGDGASHT